MDLYFIDNERGQSIPAWFTNGKVYALVRDWYGSYWVETDYTLREPCSLHEMVMLSRVYRADYC